MGYLDEAQKDIRAYIVDLLPFTRLTSLEIYLSMKEMKMVVKITPRNLATD